MLTFFAIVLARLLDPIGIGLCTLAAWWVPRYWQAAAAGAAAYIGLILAMGNPTKPVVIAATAAAGGLVGLAANQVSAWLASRRAVER